MRDAGGDVIEVFPRGAEQGVLSFALGLRHPTLFWPGEIGAGGPITGDCFAKRVEAERFLTEMQRRRLGVGSTALGGQRGPGWRSGGTRITHQTKTVEDTLPSGQDPPSFGGGSSDRFDLAIPA